MCWFLYPEMQMILAICVAMMIALLVQSTFVSISTLLNAHTGRSGNPLSQLLRLAESPINECIKYSVWLVLFLHLHEIHCISFSVVTNGHRFISSKQDPFTGAQFCRSDVWAQRGWSLCSGLLEPRCQPGRIPFWRPWGIRSWAHAGCRPSSALCRCTTRIPVFSLAVSWGPLSAPGGHPFAPAVHSTAVRLLPGRQGQSWLFPSCVTTQRKCCAFHGVTYWSHDHPAHSLFCHKTDIITGWHSYRFYPHSKGRGCKGEGRWGSS